jgi:hypothetical protein
MPRSTARSPLCSTCSAPINRLIALVQHLQRPDQAIDRPCAAPAPPRSTARSPLCSTCSSPIRRSIALVQHLQQPDQPFDRPCAAPAAPAAARSGVRSPPHGPSPTAALHLIAHLRPKRAEAHRSPALRGASPHRPQQAAGRAPHGGFPKGGHCGLARGAAMRRAKPARRPPLAGDPRGPAGPLAGGLGVGDPRRKPTTQRRTAQARSSANQEPAAQKRQDDPAGQPQGQRKANEKPTKSQRKANERPAERPTKSPNGQSPPKKTPRVRQPGRRADPRSGRAAAEAERPSPQDGRRRPPAGGAPTLSPGPQHRPAPRAQGAGPRPRPPAAPAWPAGRRPAPARAAAPRRASG